MITIIDHFKLQILTEDDVIINGTSHTHASMGDNFISFTISDNTDIEIKPSHVKMLTIEAVLKDDEAK